MNNSVYIVDGARTPFLKVKGGPGPFSASDLAQGAASGLLYRQPFTADKLDEVIVGCVAPSPDEANIARIVALRLGCGKHVPAWTVQRNCASGLQAIDSAAQSIASGRSDLVLAGGTEAMSRAPLLLSGPMVEWLSNFQRAKGGKKIQTLLKFRPQFIVPVIALLRALTDPVVNLNMGQTAEEIAYRFGISRAEMDAYALQSHQRVAKALSQGDYEEITPLYAKDGTVYEQDDGVRVDTTLDKLGKLKPVFDKHGNITPGNSSQVTDGAAFVILASEKAVQQYDLPVLAKLVDVRWAGVDPAVMGLGPLHAMTPLLIKNHLRLEDIGHVEINEAFAAQVLGCVKGWNDATYCKEALGLQMPMGHINERVLNPEGGAVALGHPVGASGARLVLHSAKMLQKYKHAWAMGSLCIGGGQGGAYLLAQSDLYNNA